jgi:hypothetical protein
MRPVALNHNAQHTSHAPCRETASRLCLASGPTTGGRPLFVFSPTSWNSRQQALTTNTCYFLHSPSQDPGRQRWWEPRFPNPAEPSRARRCRTVQCSPFIFRPSVTLPSFIIHPSTIPPTVLSRHGTARLPSSLQQHPMSYATR